MRGEGLGAAAACVRLRIGSLPSMPNTPSNKPKAKLLNTTNTMGVVQRQPKKNSNVTGAWLFSANANRVKKMAALSNHLNNQTASFMRLPQSEVILMGLIGVAEGAMAYIQPSTQNRQ
jgi:hypothetical protein